MGKVLLITGLLYLLYYGGNLVYDLFIKKPPFVRNENEGEVISLGEIREQNSVNIQNINEEDVEELNTPNSYLLDDEEGLFSDDSDSDLQQKRFDEENEIDQSASEKEVVEEEQILETDKKEKHSFLSKLSSAIHLNSKYVISKETELIPDKISDDMFRNFFEKASSHIVVENNSGQNFYKSSLIF